MVGEMSHGLAHRLEPLTICQYDVNVDDIIDLRTSSDQTKVGTNLNDLGCAWEYDLAEGREPASWTIAKKLKFAGAAGILVPSFAHRATGDMINLVLWDWGPSLPHFVSVYDPSGRLPKDQSSWPT
jgi:RES domain-containing protein